jgi:hypothetical protein
MGFEMKLSKGVWERCRWIFMRNSKVREISHRIGSKLLRIRALRHETLN